MPLSFNAHVKPAKEGAATNLGSVGWYVIRIDDPEKFGLAADMTGEAPASATQSASAEPKTADDIVYGMPGSGMPSLTAEELRGQ